MCIHQSLLQSTTVRTWSLVMGCVLSGSCGVCAHAHVWREGAASTAWEVELHWAAVMSRTHTSHTGPCKGRPSHGWGREAASWLGEGGVCRLSSLLWAIYMYTCSYNYGSELWSVWFGVCVCVCTYSTCVYLQTIHTICTVC